MFPGIQHGKVKLFVVAVQEKSGAGWWRESLSGDSARALARALALQGAKVMVARFDLERDEVEQFLNRWPTWRKKSEHPAKFSSSAKLKVIWPESKKPLPRKIV